MEQKIPEAMWLEYITKLTDRELNREKASGFTSWALLGLIGLIFFKLLDNLPMIFQPRNNSLLILLFLTNILNFLYPSFISILFIIVPFLSQTRRLTTEIGKLSARVIQYPILLVFLFVGFLNIYFATKASKIGIHSWPYYGVAVYIFGNLAVGVKNSILIKVKKRNMKYPGTAIYAGFVDPSKKKLATIVILLFVIPLFCFPSYSIYDLFHENFIIQNITLVKISFQVTIFLLAIFSFLFMVASSLKQNWLQNLEIRILTEGLTSEQIRLAFIKEYLGTTTLEWMNSLQEEIHTKFQYFTEVIKNLQPELEGIKNIDNKYKYEIKGRTTEIKERASKAFKEFLAFQLEKMTQISLFQKEAGLTKEEKPLVDLLFHDCKRQLGEVNEKWKQMKEKFEIATE